MRKFLMFLALLLVMLCMSCSNNEFAMSNRTFDTERSVKNDSLIVLQGKIAQLNYERHFVKTETRGWFSRLLRRVVADAVGGLFGNFFGGPAGAVVGAASFSALSARVSAEERAEDTREVTCMTDENTALKDVVPCDTLLVVSDLDSLGYYHNKVLLDSYNDSLAISELPKTLLENVKDSFPNLGTVSASDSLKIDNAFRTFANVEIDYDGDGSLDSYKNHLVKNYPDYKGEIGVVTEFLKGLDCTETQVQASEYVEDVLKIVDETKLSPDVKQCLRNGIIVGNASQRLWKEQDNSLSSDDDQIFLDEK